MTRSFEWTRENIRSLALQTPGWKLGVISKNGSFMVYPPNGAEAIAVANRHNPALGGAGGRAAQNTIARLKRAGLDPDLKGTELPPPIEPEPEEAPMAAPTVADFEESKPPPFIVPANIHAVGPAIATLEAMLLELVDAQAATRRDVGKLIKALDAQVAVNDRLATSYAELKKRADDMGRQLRDQEATMREQAATISNLATKSDPLAAFRERLNG